MSKFQQILSIVLMLFVFHCFTQIKSVQAVSVTPYTCTASDPPAALLQLRMSRNLSPGQNFSGEMDVVNCSGTEWTKGVYTLGSLLPTDNQTWGTGRIQLPVTLPSGNYLTVPFNLKAPSVEGSYAFQWGVLSQTAWYTPFFTPELIIVGTPAPCANKSTLQSLSNTNSDATAALQACINSIPSGGMVEIPAGEYTIYNTLRINKPIALIAEGSLQSHTTCALDEGTPCVTIKAHPDFPVNNSTNQLDTVMISIENTGQSVTNVTFKNFIFNGNFPLRSKPRDVYDLITIKATADNSKFFYNAFIDAGAHTSFGLWGEKNILVHNYALANGRHRRIGDVAYWSDGFSLVGANLTVMNNLFRNNTDVDLIFWGSPQSYVHFNTILHDQMEVESFAGLMINTWDQDEGLSDFRNSEFSYNTIKCNKLCGFGIQIGERTWRKTAVAMYGGSVIHNTVDGAKQGMNIDGAGRPGLPVTVGFNTITNSGGYSNSCGFVTGSLNQSPTDLISYLAGQTPTSTIAWGVNNCAVPSCIMDQNYCTTVTACTTTNFTQYGACVNGIQSRTVLSQSPVGCVGSTYPIQKACTNSITGDANNDGKVNGADFIIWLNHYGQALTGGASIGDYNTDGTVNGADFVLWLNNYRN